MSQFSDPHNPFSAPLQGQQPPPKKSNAWLYVLLGAGGALLVLCCGCGGFGYWAYSFGMGVVTATLKDQLNADPVAQQHLGTVTEVSVDIMASGEEQQKVGRQVLLFHVKGDQGSGDVIAEQAPGQKVMQNAILRLPNGDEHQLGF